MQLSGSNWRGWGKLKIPELFSPKPFKKKQD